MVYSEVLQSGRFGNPRAYESPIKWVIERASPNSPLYSIIGSSLMLAEGFTHLRRVRCNIQNPRALIDAVPMAMAP